MPAFFRRHPAARISLFTTAVVAALVWIIFVLGRPLPPRTVVMTTGPEGGGLRVAGEAYRRALAKERITLKLLPSAGNVENLERLKDPASGVSVGFVAGGLTSEADAPGLVSLGTIAYNPIWIFCRGVASPVGLEDLRGKRVSIGAEGSGTRAAMLELLRADGMEDAVTKLPLSPGGGGEALLRGELDCAAMLTVSDAPIVQTLLGDDRIRIVGFPRADAYVALYPHLRKLTVFRGVGSLTKDLPPEDVTILAATSSLVAREDLHPAIQFLLLEAASDIHSGSGIFRKPGRFPSAEPGDLPLSKEAKIYYKSGGTFLERNLPFWLGVLAQRILLVLIPIAGVLYPLARLYQSVVDVVVERRLRPLYAELLRIEARIARGEGGPDPALRALEARVEAIRVPAAGARLLYTLEQHLLLVRERYAARES